MSGRSVMKSHFSAWAALAAALALFLVVNYLGAKYYRQWDFTEGGLYTLAERTVNVVGSLEQDVRIVSFLDPQRSPVSADTVEQIESTLDAYRALNPARVTVERIDPYRDVARAEALLREFDIGSGDQIDIVAIESGARRKRVRLEEMVEVDLEAGYGGAAPVGNLTAESALTAAILSVTRARQPVVAFSTGHGERDAYGPGGADLGRFVETLEREDVLVREWDARAADPLPERTDLVVVAAPTEPWHDAARDSLERHLADGGRAVLLLDPVTQRSGAGELVPSGLEPLLAGWGLSVADDVVLDPSGAFFGSAARFVKEIGGGHPLTDGLAGTGLVFQVTRSVEIGESPEEVSVATLVESGATSWAEGRLSTLFDGSATPDEDDREGPFPLVVEARRSRPGASSAAAPEGGEGEGAAPREAVLVLAGDADIVANAFFDNPGNRGFALNLVSYLVDEQQALGIPPKDRELARLFLRGSELMWLFPLVVLLLPALSVAAAVGLWTRRRRD
jgi:ABC-type uncharacterized transport system involved in gliding motility auxiliary subunit